MSIEKTENMVLRTVYLPHALDLRLRAIAFTRGLSKAALMRELVQDALSRIQGEQTLADPGRKVEITTASKVRMTKISAKAPNKQKISSGKPPRHEAMEHESIPRKRAA